jgi:DNA mismatch repair protein MutS
MGRRTLERNLLQPLINRTAIEERLNLVDFFYQRAELTEEINSSLKDILDMETYLQVYNREDSTRNFIALKTVSGRCRKNTSGSDRARH